MFRSSISILALIVAASNAASLPDYFERCSLSDTKLNTCLLKNAIESWPKLIQGVKSIHLQQLDPLYVSNINAVVNDNLAGNVTNVVITGLADIKMREIILNKDKKVFDLYFLVPHLNFFGTYELKGQLINVNLDGKGILNDTFHDLDSHFHMEYELLEKKKDKHFIQPVKNSLESNTTLINFQMDNLGETVNQVLNDNWALVNKEISKAFNDVLSEVFTKTLEYFFQRVSYEELFSE